ALPDLLAGRLVDGKQPAIERNGNHLVLPERNAAVVDAAAGHVGGPGLVGLRIEGPAHRTAPAVRYVDGIDRAPAVRHIHDAVFDDGGRFQIARLVARAGAFHAAERDTERDFEVLRRIGVDLVEL